MSHGCHGDVLLVDLGISGSTNSTKRRFQATHHDETASPAKRLRRCDNDDDADDDDDDDDDDGDGGGGGRLSWLPLTFRVNRSTLNHRIPRHDMYTAKARYTGRVHGPCSRPRPREHDP